MNKRKLIRSHLLVFVIGLIIGRIGIVIAESIQSDEVLYDNSNSNTSYDNVQDAIDNLYDIYDHSSLGFSLLTHTPSGLSTSLVAGMYRYQGTTANNYICFGTTNKSTCTGDNDKYMYRIIGITGEGKLKLIKKEALNTSYQWHSSGNVADTWPVSDLYNGLNGSYFLTNTDYIPDNSWSNRIASVEWHYWQGTNGNLTAAEMANAELSAPTTNAKIGLLYLHDYEYSLPGGNNCYNTTAYGVCSTSWINLWLDQNDSNPPGGYEWSISLYNGSEVWSIRREGYLWFGSSYAWYVSKDDTNNARPVFYLNINQSIASGSGTLSDPYILS